VSAGLLRVLSFAVAACLLASCSGSEEVAGGPLERIVREYTAGLLLCGLLDEGFVAEYFGISTDELDPDLAVTWLMPELDISGPTDIVEVEAVVMSGRAQDIPHTVNVEAAGLDTLPAPRPSAIAALPARGAEGEWTSLSLYVHPTERLTGGESIRISVDALRYELEGNTYRVPLDFVMYLRPEYLPRESSGCGPRYEAENEAP